MALMAWADRVFYDGKPISYYLFAIPNGGKRNAREAARLKRMGVRAGIPDYFLHVMRHSEENCSIWQTPCGGMWLELKAQRADGYNPGPTDLQLEQLTRLKLCGYHSIVAHGWIEAAVRICEYLGLDPRGLQPCKPSS
jgi:hypothetical protein